MRAGTAGTSVVRRPCAVRCEASPLFAGPGVVAATDSVLIQRHARAGRSLAEGADGTPVPCLTCRLGWLRTWGIQKQDSPRVAPQHLGVTRIEIYGITPTECATEPRQC